MNTVAHTKENVCASNIGVCDDGSAIRREDSSTTDRREFGFNVQVVISITTSLQIQSKRDKPLVDGTTLTTIPPPFQTTPFQRV
ncbi:unnamed protein product [Toxocara canis]|uniref:Uncharacterized protein n=1 Tax=Toxocara canis TaxID=6265 RepID=A0A183UUK2_TOXCA|nr:unnamed protein product [Toxocara canis]